MNATDARIAVEVVAAALLGILGLYTFLGDRLAVSPAVGVLVVLLFCLVVLAWTFRSRPTRDLTWGLGSALVWTVLAGLVTWGTGAFPAFTFVPSALSVFVLRFRLLEAERNRMYSFLERHVSYDVLRDLMARPDTTSLARQRRRITMLFSDINGFTSACERLDPEEVLTRLNNYLAEMTQIVFRNGGTIRQFVGDEIVVFFGAPVEMENHGEMAVRTALEMLDRLRVLSVEDPEGFHKVKIGIHTGEVVVGDVGSSDRAEYAAVGDAMNTTARIEALNKQFGTELLISNATRMEALGRIEGVRFESVGFQTFKGKMDPVEVFRVVRKGSQSGTFAGV